MEQPLSNPPEIYDLDTPEDARVWINEFYEWSTRIPDLLPRINIYSTVIDPTSVAANTTAEQTFTVKGLITSDIVVAAQKPSLTAGLGIAGSRVSAVDTLAITFINATAAAIDAASETYSIVTIRN